MRAYRRTDELLDDYAELRAQGATREVAAARMGIALRTLERMLQRHRGDPRAVLGVRRTEYPRWAAQPRERGRWVA